MNTPGCNGVRGEVVHRITQLGEGGVLDLSLLAAQKLVEGGFPKLGKILLKFESHGVRPQYEDNKHKIPAWVGQGSCVRSSVCVGSAAPNAAMCENCGAVQKCRSFQQSLRRHARRDGEAPHAKARNDTLTSSEKDAKLARNREQRLSGALQNLAKERQLRALRKRGGS